MTEYEPMNRTDAQKLSKESLDDLAAQLESGKSDSLVNFIATMAKFHQYSWGNVMMIAAQRPDASHVAGVRTWNGLGRFVRKGEKGIAIFAPMRFKANEETAGRKAEEERVNFRVVHVFDISQTEGQPLPEPETVRGEPTKHLENLKRFITGKGIELEYHENLGNAKGKSCKGTI